LQKSVLSESVRLEDFVKELGSRDIIKTPKIAAFMSGNPLFVPRSLLHNVKHNGTIHSTTLVVCVQTEEFPFVNAPNRYSIADLGYGVYQIIVRYGFMESPDIPRDIAEVPLPMPASKDPSQVSYFLGKESLVLSRRSGMALWRKQVFIFLARNSLSASAFFHLPPNRVVELGVQVEL
jgi:KUP system potassium uptake protein